MVINFFQIIYFNIKILGVNQKTIVGYMKNVVNVFDVLLLVIFFNIIIYFLNFKYFCFTKGTCPGNAECVSDINC